MIVRTQMVSSVSDGPEDVRRVGTTALEWDGWVSEPVGDVRDWLAGHRQALTDYYGQWSEHRSTIRDHGRPVAIKIVFSYVSPHKGRKCTDAIYVRFP
jgi:hypothetical protein